ncbi:MAG: 50S ribosome-binding GTPase, partial [bacterium]|nr:50S ribosome-binding GTPase [bacterium]
WWPDSRSFTGESCAELHFLGALPITEAMVEQIVALGGKPANRGEFTLRSFLAGKIDLTQAEAVLNVIEADDELQLTWALENLAGNISKPVRALREKLLELTAHLEAGLDFVEEDIEFIDEQALLSALGDVDQQLESLLQRLDSRGGRSRRPSVALVGLPNSGKSTLFNRLVGSERSIVSEQAGTTRDVVTAELKVSETLIELVDTAGVETLNDDSPRSLAQFMLRDKLRQADLLLLCVAPQVIGMPASSAADLPEEQGDAVGGTSKLDDAFVDQATLAAGFVQLLEHLGDLVADVPYIQVGMKSDLGLVPYADVSVSALDDDSLLRLAKSVETRLAAEHQGRYSEAMHATTIRCRESLQLARQAIHAAVAATLESEGEEIVALELRLAIDQLAAVIGEVHTEDILGEIFGRFCIGK